jgi:hypothetical protein
VKEFKEGDLRVWWIPQVSMRNVFYVFVKDVEQAKLVLNALANYDLFQYHHRVKPDYSNAGGLEVYEKNYDGVLGWSEWYSEHGEDIDEVMKEEFEARDECGV